ncbi:aldo/keto reductase [Pedobacter agri]|uniref:aldo/keto reductase n=1 Tax=Pedobacter agri TaxID=454586 RepID=UPI00278225FA|nr:aldo/keto reductase [Pedobacter agri]MDQ1140465.1 aryl-alcohol dehydrogenase-like predicted oxidoreductase [Pedobacter agri]
MEYRKIGNSDLELSAITFGAWAAGGWMWGSTDRNDAIKAIQAGYDLGVTSIDTAPIYGQGDSEEIVGEAVKGIARDKIQLVTKFGMRWDLEKGKLAMQTKNNDGKDIDVYKYAGRESVIFECEQSLKRLGTDYIDLYQIHWPDVTTPISETFEAVSRLIEQGKVRYAGVCNYDVAQLKEADQTLEIISNQIPFSMVNRAVEEEIIPFCLEHNKSVLAYSPMERGLLTGKMTTDYKFEEGDHRQGNKFFTPESIQKTNAFLAKLKPLAEEKNATLSQLVLRWTIERPGITIALVGARNEKQAIQNAEAINVKLSADEIQFINTALKNAGF